MAKKQRKLRKSKQDKMPQIDLCEGLLCLRVTTIIGDNPAEYKGRIVIGKEAKAEFSYTIRPKSGNIPKGSRDVVLNVRDRHGYDVQLEAEVYETLRSEVYDAVIAYQATMNPGNEDARRILIAAIVARATGTEVRMAAESSVTSCVLQTPELERLIRDHARPGEKPGTNGQDKTEIYKSYFMNLENGEIQ